MGYGFIPPSPNYAIMPEITWFDSDVYKLLLRLFINIVFVTLIVGYVYRKNNKDKDYIFTYYVIGFVTFFLCFSLKKLDIDTGMGLGLFAIFGIIRYRTNQIAIKEMTYLFAVIGISVINALAANKISMIEMLIINFFVVGLVGMFEYFWMPKHQIVQTMMVLSLKNTPTLDPQELREKLAEDTKLDISHIKINKINYSNKNVHIDVFYREKQ